MTYLGADILAQEEYFKQLTAADQGRSVQEDDHLRLHSFLFESGDTIDRLYEISQEPDFSYPALVMFMPAIDMDDNGYGLIDAQQDNAFAILVQPVEQTAAAKNEAIKQAQLAAFRVIRQIRKDARTGQFRLPEQRKWKIRPMSNVGPQRVCGVLVDFKFITNANALVGSND